MKPFQKANSSDSSPQQESISPIKRSPPHKSPVLTPPVKTNGEESNKLLLANIEKLESSIEDYKMALCDSMDQNDSLLTRIDVLEANIIASEDLNNELERKNEEIKYLLEEKDLRIMELEWRLKEKEEVILRENIQQLNKN